MCPGMLVDTRSWEGQRMDRLIASRKSTALLTLWLRLRYYLQTSGSRNMREFISVIASPCLENPMDGGAWWATVHGVTKSRSWLSDFTFTFHFYAMEKEMATHSSVLAWRIPGTAEPGGLLSMGLHRIGHNWSNLAAAAAVFVVICYCSTGKNVPYNGLLYSNKINELLHMQLGWISKTTLNKMSQSQKTIHYVVSFHFSSVQLLSRVRLFATPWTAAHQASLSITNSLSPPKPMPIELVMLSNHLIFCRPLLLLPSIFPSIRVLSNESTLRIRWPNYWILSFNISPSKEHPGLISFKMDWLDLLAVQETLKSLFQHHSSKASVFGIQLSLYSNSHIHTRLLEKP